MLLKLVEVIRDPRYRGYTIYRREVVNWPIEVETWRNGEKKFKVIRITDTNVNQCLSGGKRLRNVAEAAEAIRVVRATQDALSKVRKSQLRTNRILDSVGPSDRPFYQRYLREALDQSDSELHSNERDDAGKGETRKEGRGFHKVRSVKVRTRVQRRAR